MNLRAVLLQFMEHGLLFAAHKLVLFATGPSGASSLTRGRP